jgi:hypothetical protein
MFYPDYESYCMILVHDRVMGTAMIAPDELKLVEAHLRERQEMVRYGVTRCPTWFMEELLKLDGKMRAWWDSWAEQWILDRLQDEGFYITVMRFKPDGELQLDQHLIEFLRANDMHRFTPAEHRKKKQEAADATQKRNDRAASEKVLAAVDSLSSKALREFIAVEEAIQSGETITAHGDTLNFIEKARKAMAAANREAEEKGLVYSEVADAGQCINPGMAPNIYRRTRKDRQ